MPSLRKIREGDYNLSTFERALLATFIGFQEVRTPWTRRMFHQMEEETTTSTMHFAANQPGYFEKIFEQLKAEGNARDVTPDQLREALRDGRIKAKAQPHSGLDLVASMGMFLGNFYTRMLWTVLRAMEGEFVTSDTPVVRRDAGFKGGFYGWGLMSSTRKCGFRFRRRPVSSSATTPRWKISFLNSSAKDEGRKRRLSSLLCLLSASGRLGSHSSTESTIRPSRTPTALCSLHSSPPTSRQNCKEDPKTCVSSSRRPRPSRSRPMVEDDRKTGPKSWGQTGRSLISTRRKAGERSICPRFFWFMYNPPMQGTVEHNCARLAVAHLDPLLNRIASQMSGACEHAPS